MGLILNKILFPILFMAIQFATALGDIDLVGPRAGIGFWTKKKGISLDGGMHSAFGWQIEVPYRSDNFVGYGEAGFLLLGVEQGLFYPHIWGFFGMRYQNFGFGLGPVANISGIGIGFGPY